MIRLFTSLNWVFGVLALMFAFGYSFISSKAMEWPQQTTGEAVVHAVAKAERTQFSGFEKYMYFSSEVQSLENILAKLGMDVPGGVEDFDIVAFRTKEEALIIRATLKKQIALKGWLPPMIYEYVIKRPGETGSGKWIKFSNATVGLI